MSTPPPRPPSAAYFDQWYADMVGSPVKDEIEQRHLGLPPHLLSTGMLTSQGLEEVTEALALGRGLRAGAVLLDLACGRGGYGLEISRRTGADLVGVDFSAEAVRQAGALARRLGRRADFRVGRLDATGLGDASVDAVVVVDSIQFAEDPPAAYAELARVLRPGGRVAVTTWEVAERDDESQPDRLRAVDVRGGLTGAGFTDVEVLDRDAWRVQERAMWEEAAALDPGDDPALQSFHDEGLRSLEHHDARRRVLGTATAP